MRSVLVYASDDNIAFLKSQQLIEQAGRSLPPRLDATRFGAIFYQAACEE